MEKTKSAMDVHTTDYNDDSMGLSADQRSRIGDLFRERRKKDMHKTIKELIIWLSLRGRCVSSRQYKRIEMGHSSVSISLIFVLAAEMDIYLGDILPQYTRIFVADH